jgi:polar amino acid transport system substrate-binding protein
MKQLLLNARSGEVEVVEIAAPALCRGCLLVRNVCSAISPGTERTKISTVRGSYLRTARNRPDLVRKVLDTVKREGLFAAYGKVRSKLNEPQALGYSSAGIVEAVGERAGDYFRAGDRVACAGAGYASHAEVICVPVNLAARIPAGVSFDAAAFATLGAIALHGVRQAGPSLGERFAVVGLGVIGLLTVQLLQLSGARVAAYDLESGPVARAEKLGAELALGGGVRDQVQSALAWTEGLGVDGVLVTAASSGDAPMVAAAGMCRDRARVVALGLVPFGLPREIAYEKELELKISRSYGPGRYDAGFEEKGIDYPPGYVRWTETRNLEAFLELLRGGKVDIASLITRRYRLEAAPEAYDTLCSAGGEQPVGIVIDYPEPSEPDAKTAAPAGEAVSPVVEAVPGEIGVAFIGAGAFARSTLLPCFKAATGVALRQVVTARGLSARDAQSRFGFAHAGTDPDVVLADPGVHLVCVATRHDLHADLVVRALEMGKHVFVEKPLALDEEQLRHIERVASSAGGLLMVGFNRRFSPMARAVGRALGNSGPLMMTYRVNAGSLPAGHWLNDPETGGGRMIGEGCHFIDMFSFLTGDRRVVNIQAECLGASRSVTEDFAAQVAFEDGSVGQLLYVSRGDTSLGKERLEVHAGGASAVIEDYRACTIRSGGRSTKVRQGGKGHAEEVDALLSAVRSGGPPPMSLEALLGITRVTFSIHDLLTGPRREA